MASNSLDRHQVESWLAGVREEALALEGRLKPLLEERSRLEERQRILRSLLSSFDESGGPATGTEDSRPTAASSVGPPAGSVKEYVESRVIEVLEESDRDRLHINDIYARFRDKGYEVPGAGKPVNITSHIRVSERIRSPKRGYYGLVERVGDIPPRAAKQKPRTKKRK